MDMILLVLVILALTSVPTASEFVCGNAVCERRGYVACIQYEKGEDDFCLTCTTKNAKCGTDDEQVGCNRFCQDLVLNRTMDEIIEIQKTINATFSEKILNLEREKENALKKSTREKEEAVAKQDSEMDAALEKSQRETRVAIGVCVGVLVVGLLLALVVLFKYRQRCKTQRHKDPEKAVSECDTPNKGGQQPGSVDETIPMLLDTMASPQRISTGCQTDSQDKQMKEMAICNGATPNGCPTANKFNQIQPTQDHREVKLEMPDHKHVGLGQHSQPRQTATVHRGN